VAQGERFDALVADSRLEAELVQRILAGAGVAAELEQRDEGVAVVVAPRHAATALRTLEGVS
jgi:hypothetical protein